MSEHLVTFTADDLPHTIPTWLCENCKSNIMVYKYGKTIQVRCLCSGFEVGSNEDDATTTTEPRDG